MHIIHSILHCQRASFAQSVPAIKMGLVGLFGRPVSNCTGCSNLWHMGCCCVGNPYGQRAISREIKRKEADLKGMTPGSGQDDKAHQWPRCPVLTAPYPSR